MSSHRKNAAATANETEERFSIPVCVRVCVCVSWTQSCRRRRRRRHRRRRRRRVTQSFVGEVDTYFLPLLFDLCSAVWLHLLEHNDEEIPLGTYSSIVTRDLSQQ